MVLSLLPAWGECTNVYVGERGVVVVLDGWKDFITFHNKSALPIIGYHEVLSLHNYIPIS